MSRNKAIELGLALGLVVGLAIVVGPLARDDFSRVFWKVGRSADPYNNEWGFWYPIWAIWVLRAWALLPRMAGLVLVWVINVGIMFWACRLWRTPAWACLVSPPFLFGLIMGHPFEAFFLAGISLGMVGWKSTRPAMVGLGLCLMAFKPQLAFVPAAVMVLALCCEGQKAARWCLVPVGMALVSTALDWAISGRLWVMDWLQAMGAGQGEWVINQSTWASFLWATPLWLVPAGWLLWQRQASFVGKQERELWVLTALGLLIGPYWGAYTLWPLVAMAGSWREAA